MKAKKTVKKTTTKTAKLHQEIRDGILAALVVCEDVAGKFAEADTSGYDALARVAARALREQVEWSHDDATSLPHTLDAAHALVTLLRNVKLATAQPLLDQADSWLDELAFGETGSLLGELAEETERHIQAARARREKEAA
jgi:hypothetical protein